MGMWVAGMAVYGSCVFCANAVVATKMHLHSSYSFGLFGLMILGYFVMYWLFNSGWIYKKQIYMIYWTQLGIPLIWLTYMLNLFQVFVTEKMYRALSRRIENTGDSLLRALGQIDEDEYKERIDRRNEQLKHLL